MKKLVSILLLISFLNTTIAPVYAQDASSSAAPGTATTASPSAGTSEPASSSGELLPVPITRLPEGENTDAVFSPSTENLTLDFDEPLSSSALIKQPISIRPLTKQDFRAYETVVFTVDNASPEDLQIKVKNVNDEPVDANVQLVDDAEAVMVRISPPQNIKPGKYTTEVKSSDDISDTIDFTWGVLALNTDKSIYAPNETARLLLGMTDDQGNIVCNASFSIKITDPAKNITELSSENGKVRKYLSCEEHKLSVQADYDAEYTVTSPGIYDVVIEAKTGNQTHTLRDILNVQDRQLPYTVKREMPTRIYPRDPYPVNLTITANEDFTGTIRDIVPGEFVITPSTASASLSEVTERVSSNSAQLLATRIYPIGQIRLPFDGEFPLSLDFSGEVQDPFLRRLYTGFGLVGHDGLDFAMPIGTPILATDTGTVVWAGPGDYGITVVIEHSWGKSYYGHLREVKVTEGQFVTIGTEIGISGNTGISTGPHLHFGIKPTDNDPQNGYYGKIDPLPYLSLSENSKILLARTTGDPQTVKIISWELALKKGETITLSYALKAPEEHPAIYMVGPAQFVKPTDDGETIVQSETRLWQHLADQSPVLAANTSNLDQTSFPMQQIDPTLLQTPEGYSLLPAGFDRNMRGQLASIKVDKDTVKTSVTVKDESGVSHTASFTMQNASAGETQRDNYTLNRNDIFPNTDMQYATFDGFLQQIIEVKNAQSRREFAFSIELSENLAIMDLHRSDGYLILKQKTTDEDLLMLRFPQGVDAKQQRIDYKYRLENNELILYPNRAWQYDQAVFPIKIYAPINVIAWDEVGVVVGDGCEDGKPCERDGDISAIKPAGWHWSLSTIEKNVVVRVDKMNEEKRRELTATTLKPDYVKDEHKMREFKGKDKERVDQYDGLSRFGIDYTQLATSEQLARVRNKNKAEKTYAPMLDARKNKTILRKKQKNIASVISSTRKLAYQKPKEPTIFQRLAKFIIKPTSAATIQTASIGAAAGRDYAAPQDWETDNDNNLVSADLVEKGEMYADDVFTAAILGNYTNFTGATTDATRYMWLTAALSDRHIGLGGAGTPGVLVDCEGVTNLGTTGFNVETDYTVIEWLKITDCRGSSGRGGVRLDEVTGLVAQNLVIYDFDNAATATGISIGSNATADTGTIRNTIIYDGNAAGGIRGDGTADNLIIQNVTIWGSNQMSRGLREDTSDFDSTNVIVMDTTSVDFEIVNGSNNYCLSEDTTADDFGGTGNIANITSSGQFNSTTLGSEDLHLIAGSNAIDTGTTISGYNNDVDDGIRQGTWDIGADEYKTNLNDRLMRHGKYFGTEGTRKPFTF